MSKQSRSPSPHGRGASNRGKVGKRLFIVGHKSITEDEYRAAFEPYGKIDDVFVLKSKGTDSKGIVYITMSKISEAALAIEELNGKHIGESQKFIKVMVASDKKGDHVSDACEDEKYHRLFIMIKRDDTEETIREKFSEFGKVTDVSIVKNKRLCFVKYASRYSAALALENVDSDYRPVFATPKSAELRRDPRDSHLDDPRGIKRSRYDGSQSDFYFPSERPLSYDRRPGSYDHATAYSNSSVPLSFDRPPPSAVPMSMVPTTQLSQTGECSVHVTVATTLSEANLRRLFDIVPGMCGFKYTVATGIAMIRYAAPEYANYAVEKLDGFEYPSGHCLIVRLSDQLLDGQESSTDQLQRAAAILQQAGINPQSVLATQQQVEQQTPKDVERVPYCDFDVPPRQCTKPISTPVEKRLFVICQPTAIPTTYLKDIFCRFGDLIEIHMVRDRNFGYAKFASTAAADYARDYLHMKSVAGCRLKVIDAEEKGQSAGGASDAPKTDEPMWA